MIKLIKISGWELKDYKSYFDDECIVALLAPLHEENLGLKFDIMNIFPPKGKRFWSFSLYNQIQNGSQNYCKNFANDETREQLRDVLDLYWGNDITSALLSMRGAIYDIGGFGCEFESAFAEIDNVVARDFFMSVAIPANSEDTFYDYFCTLEMFLGDDSLMPSNGIKDIDYSFIDLLTQILSAPIDEMDNFDFDTANTILDKCLSDCEKVHMNSIGRGVNIFIGDAVKNEKAVNLFLKKLNWIVNNYPLYMIESYKEWINMSFWGAVKHSHLRNIMRMSFDKSLIACPVIQTNPYEDFG
jgi:hypothetical protein